MHQVATRIYNTVVHLLSVKLSKRGFAIACSDDRPEDGVSKYTIWQRNKDPVFYLLFKFNKDTGNLELYSYDIGAYDREDAIPDISSSGWLNIHEEHIYEQEEDIPTAYLQGDTEEDETEEFIEYCTRNIISVAMYHTVVVTPEYIQEHEQASRRKPEPDPEQEARQLDRKSKWRRYAWIAGSALWILLLLARIIDYQLADDTPYQDVPDMDKHPTKEQMQKVIELYRLRNEDSVLMKDTSSIYYRYKKKLEAMGDSL